MKKTLGLVIAVATLVGGCAATGKPETASTSVEPQKVAQADCKIYLRESATAVSSGPAPANDALDRQHAASRLATSDLRWRALNRPFGSMNVIEEALRDCGH